MKYAIVDIAGKQYKVEEGQELLVDRLKEQEGKTNFDKVLLVVDQNNLRLGSSVLGKVEAEVLGETKGEKIRVLKYKAKSRYRKSRGFRRQLTRIKITKITS